MSNYLAIATVTATLQRLLQSTVQLDLDGARVTTVRPDSIGSGTPESGVNLYLYNVTPNPAWRNVDLRTRSAEGHVVKRPQAALDLYYLITCYGNEGELEPQRLLGSVIRTLHAQPVITAEMVRDAVADVTFPFLITSNLNEQVESVKFMPVPFTLEQLSNLWSVFSQSPHLLSIAYQAGVLLIESDDIPQRALPVRERQFYATPSQPTIERVQAQKGALHPITIDSTLVIYGQQLSGDETQIRIGEAKRAPTEMHPDRLLLSLAEFPAEALRAGVQGVQVIRREPGNTALPSRGVESNVAAFVLRPTITAVTVSQVEAEEDLRSAEIQIALQPPVGQTQRVFLILNEINPRQPHAYTFDALPHTTTTEVVVGIRDVMPGTYLVRVQVDGAESLLGVDRDPTSPTFEQYIGPVLTIP